MTVLKSFKAIRPTTELAGQVAALPYDVMNSNEARKMVKDNPYSFLHVDKAEIDLADSVDPYDQQVYLKAHDNLQKMIEQGILIQDEESCLYIYQQVMDGRAQTGLVGCTAIDDYLANRIKKHENTRADKEKDRIKHVDACNANTGPIFMTYRAKESIDALIDQWMNSHQSVCDFVADDKVAHRVWVVDDQAVISELVEAFAQIDSLYIADGHHRAASAVQVGLKRREEHPDFQGDEEFNYFLAVLFPDQQLQIMDYNRLVKDLYGHSAGDFLERIKANFYIHAYVGNGAYKPKSKHHFGMYLNGQWYVLQAKPGSFREDDPVDRLDVSILQENLLKPILGIEDPRTDKRIDFVGGIRGLGELEQRVYRGMTVAFALYPTTIEDLMAIADSGEVMPPKSTWFEPKLRSGLFVHQL